MVLLEEVEVKSAAQERITQPDCPKPDLASEPELARKEGAQAPTVVESEERAIAEATAQRQQQRDRISASSEAAAGSSRAAEGESRAGEGKTREEGTEPQRGSSGNSSDEFHDAQERAGEDEGSGKSAGEGGDGETRGDSARASGGGEEEEAFEDSMTEDELRKKSISEAEELKAQGNAEYGRGEFVRAMQRYSAALELCPAHEDSLDLRAACHANLAVCLLCVEEYAPAVKACSAALELKPGYVKALLRRAQAHEKLDKLEEALADYQKSLELDSTNTAARGHVRRLTPVVEERREKLKEEMLGKLKDLGNSVLGHFGLSLDNFNAVKDPETGSYSINFQS